MSILCAAGNNNNNNNMWFVVPVAAAAAGTNHTSLLFLRQSKLPVAGSTTRWIRTTGRQFTEVVGGHSLLLRAPTVGGGWRLLLFF